MTDHALPIPSPLPPPPPKAKPRTAVVVLSALVLALVGASVVAIVLFVGARDEHGLEVQRLDQTNRTLTEAEGRLADTEKSIDTVEGRISTLEGQNAELHKCADPAKESINAAKGDDDALLRDAVGRAEDNC